MNTERKRVSVDWNEKIDVRSSLEYENAYDEMFEVDKLFQEIEDQICSAGLLGTGYVSIREDIRQSWENHQALEAFTVSLVDYMDSKLDRPFASGLNKGAVHTLSLIKMEDFKTYKTGNLGHGYYDHGNLYSNQGSGYALTFQDFLGIAGNGAEGEAEYMGGQVTVNDNYVRSFAEVYKKQYETFGDKSVTLEEYLNELYSSGEFVHKRDQPVKEFLSSLLDMAPVAGSVKNFIEMGIGKDIITGDELTQMEQRTKTLRMLADVVAMEFALGDIGTGFHDGMRVDYQIGKDKLGELNGAKVIAESDYAFHMDGLSSYNGGMYSKFGEMSWTEGERYSSFLKNGSSDGLTDLEVQAARKAEDQIVLNKIDGDQVLKVRGGGKTSYGKSNLNPLKNIGNFADASIESGSSSIKNNLINKIKDIRGEMPNTNLAKRGNMAVADVDIPGIKDNFVAHSKINAEFDKGVDVADFSYLKPENERIFTTYVDDQYPRYHDTEAKILEDIASQITDSNVSGTINLYSELPCCQSCSNIILEFRRKFPNIKLNVYVE